MSGERRPASLSLDLDNQWSYMKTHGDAGWDSFPSYLDPLVEIVLDRLHHNRLKVTVFVVGQDAALDKNREALGRLGAAGLELGNHSFHHEPWLQFYSADEVAREIETAENAIAAATGRVPHGFRGPGFTFSGPLLDVLARRGYHYDASTFPTFLGPLARAYYFWQSRGLSREERAKRSKLFGTMSEGLRPLKPYLWSLGDRELLEIPVTTMPIARVPMHLSYLIYLWRHSPFVARTYLRLAIALCRVTGTEPSFLLHPLDFLGCDRCDALSFFPGMDLRTETKLAIFDEVVARLGRHFELVTMEEHATRVLGRRLARRPAPAPVTA